MRWAVQMYWGGPGGRVGQLVDVIVWVALRDVQATCHRGRRHEAGAPCLLGRDRTRADAPLSVSTAPETEHGPAASYVTAKVLDAVAVNVIGAVP